MTSTQENLKYLIIVAENFSARFKSKLQLFISTYLSERFSANYLIAQIINALFMKNICLNMIYFKSF